MAGAHTLSAAELAVAYRSRQLSPVEALLDILKHIGHCESSLQALYAFDPDAALATARASEARWLRAAPLSPLDGVPVTIKENIATQGVAVPLGCAATLLQPATADAPPAARLREAGAVILAKTTMPDLGMLSSSLSSFHPLTRNPWDTRKTPGGSSAGAGAAAAAGYGPLHIGTDIGGSIRLPAAWCGVVGFKPSGGRVPIHPPYTGRVAGPMTRSVADAAIAMQVLSRPDWRDATSLPWQDIAWHTAASADLSVLRGLRIGLLLDAGWGLPVDAATRVAVLDAARRFESAGAIVTPMEPISSRAMVGGLDRFWRLRAWADLQAMQPERRALVLPYIQRWAEGAAGLAAVDLFHGHAQIAALRDAAVAGCRSVDIVLSPVSPVPAFDAQLASPLDDPDRPFEHIAFTLPFNMSEQPAISVPCAMTHDAQPLPIGLQLAGQRHDDLRLLCVARAWEALRGALPLWPPGVADRTAAEPARQLAPESRG
jgi:Asp-tRNA(Asn)/Glu-tRNA(Gln) amidotransferase A subunit family amidase